MKLRVKSVINSKSITPPSNLTMAFGMTANARRTLRGLITRYRSWCLFTYFEHIFNTDHESITRQIIMTPETRVNQILSQVAPDFPAKVASVIDHTYPNPQVVQMISSQIDADRMDYLLRDAYNTGTKYGEFDLTRVLRVMRPYANGIAFLANGMHAVEDYIVSRFQMYQQVYFHPVSRGMEVVLQKLLQRAKFLYEQPDHHQSLAPQLLIPSSNRISPCGLSQTR